MHVKLENSSRNLILNLLSDQDKIEIMYYWNVYTFRVCPHLEKNRIEWVAWTLAFFAWRRNSQVSPAAPWSGAPTNWIEHQNPRILIAFSASNFPFTGWRASPVFCAMQEPIPDFKVSQIWMTNPKFPNNYGNRPWNMVITGKYQTRNHSTINDLELCLANSQK